MGYIMHCSFARAMGFNWPKELAMIVNGERVTWAQVRESRRKRQAERLVNIRKVREPQIVPAFVWTFYVPGPFFGGWWCYICTIHGREHGRFGVKWGPLAENLMTEISLGLLPFEANWELWMKLLAKAYPRQVASDRRRAGSVVGWFDRQSQTFKVDSRHAGTARDGRC